VGRVAGHAVAYRVRHVGDGIASARVFGQRTVVQVYPARAGVHDDVLQDGAEAAGRLVDLRLALGVELDDLGVAAAFVVEHTVVAPAVLVVADEAARRVAAERRLARAAEAEEEGHVIARLAKVGAAMHGHHTLLGHEVVHGGEDALLDLAAVLRAADEHQAAAEIEQDERLALGSIQFRLGLQPRHVNDGEFGHVIAQLLRVELADEHVAREQVVPGVLGNDAHRHTVVQVCANVAVKDEDVAVLGVGQHLPVEVVEVFLCEGAVDFAPPDVRFARRLLDNELVVGGAAGVAAGLHDQRAKVGDCSLVPADSLLIEHGGSEVPVNGFGVLNAMILDAVMTDESAIVLHGFLTPMLVGKDGRVRVAQGIV